MITALAALFLAAGLFFILIGNIGLLRFPDFFSRAHSTGVGDTLGVILVIIGLIFLEGLTLNSAKLFFIVLFIFFTNPTATHALTRAALKFRLRPFFREDRPPDEEKR